MEWVLFIHLASVCISILCLVSSWAHYSTCHYSSIISRKLGSNSVDVLSTLIFIYYTKILHTIITSLSYTSLEYPDSSIQNVWLPDGGVPYFKHKNHVLLGVFAILMLCIFLFPYTLLKLFGHKIRWYLNRRFLSWINRIVPFLDAYHAPFKVERHYWIELILFVRCSLLLTFALNTLGSANLNLVVITSLTAGLMGIAWLRGRVYLKLYIWYPGSVHDPESLHFIMCLKEKEINMD